MQVAQYLGPEAHLLDYVCEVLLAFYLFFASNNNIRRPNNLSTAFALWDVPNFCLWNPFT